MTRGRPSAKNFQDVKVSSRSVVVAGVLLIIVQCLMVPGLSNPFRLPKLVLLVGLVGALAGMSIAIQIFKTGRISCRWPLAACLLTYPVLQALSLFWSGVPQRALSAVLLSLSCVLITLWMASLNADQRRQLVRFASVGALVSCAVLFLQFLGASPFETTDTGRRSLSGLAGNPSDLAASAVLLLPLLLFTAREGIRKRWFDWTAAVLLSLSVFITMSLTGCAVLVLFWLVVLAHQRRSRKAWALAFASLLLLVVVAEWTDVNFRASKAVRGLKEGKVKRVLTSRTDGWLAGIEMWRSSPLTGVGAANFTHSYYPSILATVERSGPSGSRGETSTHFDWAHNDPLQVCAELGVLGAIWIGWLAFSLVSEGRRKVWLLAAAAVSFCPFLFLQYPTHIAVALIPTLLLVAEFASSHMTERTLSSRPLRLITATAILVSIAAIWSWSIAQVSHSRWTHTTRLKLKAAASLQGPQRVALCRQVEEDANRYASQHTAFAPEALRVVAQSHLLRSNFSAAEAALRKSHELWPHEAAELGLGLTLAAQGRRSEAVPHLANLVRVNRRIRRTISDRSLRKEVDAYIKAHAAQTLDGSTNEPGAGQN